MEKKGGGRRPIYLFLDQLYIYILKKKKILIFFAIVEIILIFYVNLLITLLMVYRCKLLHKLHASSL